MKSQMNKVVSSGNKPGNNVGVKIPCKKISDREEFMCQASDLYRALTEKEVGIFIVVNHRSE